MKRKKSKKNIFLMKNDRKQYNYRKLNMKWNLYQPRVELIKKDSFIDNKDVNKYNVLWTETSEIFMDSNYYSIQDFLQ